MDRHRFNSITARFQDLRLAIVGDFCLDRYLEIDPALSETSIETGLPVHNVTRVRAQPGAAGTILNNLVALGIGTIYPIGFAGFDGEGYELLRALEALPGVNLNHFLKTDQRRTFTYCKPLVMEQDRAPRELNRLDSKNWTPTPPDVERAIILRLQAAAREVNAVIVLDQVDLPETGVVTRNVLSCLESITAGGRLLCLGDSRRGLAGFPAVAFKMNAVELARVTGMPAGADLQQIGSSSLELARRNSQPVFVTLSERGILGATASGEIEHRPALPIRGEIDIVGAGDAVSASLTSALAAGASVGEAVEFANAAASVVIHKLGTTGTASPDEIRPLLFL